MKQWLFLNRKTKYHQLSARLFGRVLKWWMVGDTFKVSPTINLHLSTILIHHRLFYLSDWLKASLVIVTLGMTIGLSAQIPFNSHPISTKADVASSVYAADVDGDGDLDILSASSGDDKIAWYENDGSQNFTTHPISTTTFQAVSVYAADVDGDGDLDVLGASERDDKIA